jgi:peptide deformylase
MVSIVTVDGPEKDILQKKTTDIQNDEWDLAQEIVGKLHEGLKPFLPAAGLAAHQIGISKSIFIFSFDRDPKNMEAAINPTFKPVDQVKNEGWEGCFSVLLSQNKRLAKVPRYHKIAVSYFTAEGKKVEKILEGFAAKVFQHEYDHLQGMENINRPDAEVKSFQSDMELEKFMKEMKEQDSLRYKKPE